MSTKSGRSACLNGPTPQRYRRKQPTSKGDFVDPENPEMYTQTIESTWGKFKEANRHRGGTNRHLFLNFLSEYLWKKKFAGPDSLHQLWKHVSDVFVSVNGEIDVRQTFDCEWDYDVFDE